MKYMTGFSKILIMSVLFLLLMTSLSHAEGDYVNLRITILDYHGKISDTGKIKFIIDEIVSGGLGKKFFHPGKIVTSPIEGEKMKDVYLFDTAKITLRKTEKTLKTENLEIIEKYNHKIELPLDLQTNLTCDKKEYKRGEKVRFTITARNDGKKTVILPLPTAKQYDFKVRNKNGDLVWQWSDGKFFINMLQSMIFALREEKVYTQEWNMKDNNGRTVPPGVYQVEGSLATNPSYPVGTGRIKFIVK